MYQARRGGGPIGWARAWEKARVLLYSDLPTIILEVIKYNSIIILTRAQQAVAHPKQNGRPFQQKHHQLNIMMKRAYHMSGVNAPIRHNKIFIYLFCSGAAKITKTETLTFFT